MCRRSAWWFRTRKLYWPQCHQRRSPIAAYGNVLGKIRGGIRDAANNGARVWLGKFEAVEDPVRVTLNQSFLEPSSSSESGSLSKRKKKMAGSNGVCNDKTSGVRFSKIRAHVSTSSFENTVVKPENHGFSFCLSPLLQQSEGITGKLRKSEGLHRWCHDKSVIV